MKGTLKRSITGVIAAIMLFAAGACEKGLPDDNPPVDVAVTVTSITGPSTVTEGTQAAYTAVLSSPTDKAVVWGIVNNVESTEGRGVILADSANSTTAHLSATTFGLVTITAHTGDAASAKRFNVTIAELPPLNEAFITAADGKFWVGDPSDGEEFKFLGTNNYGMHYKSDAMIDDVIVQSADMGIKVIRMWGFFDGWLDEGRANYAYGQILPGVFEVSPSDDEEGFGEVLYDRHTGAVREPVSIYDRMDYTLKRASQYGVRLLITLSNYYTPFGGQQQYVDWYNEMNNANLGKSAFLTNATIKQWYKNMLDYVLNRENKLTGVKYKDDPTVFAWELCNEPEGTAALVNWAAEMSAYVKTIDSKHLVSVGDQGPLGGMTTTGPVSWDINGDGTVDALDYRADTTGDGKPDATYNLTKTGVGTNGYGYANSASHEQLIALPNVDFGTFHLYPDHWGVSKDVAVEYGVKYIQDHIALGQVYGKPTVAEEYGVMRPTLDESKRINRYLAFDMWNQAILDLNGSASMFWTLTGIEDGPDSDANGNYPDFDGFRVLNDGSEVPELLKQYARVFNGEQESIIRSDAIYLLTPVLSEISKASSITVEAKVVTVSNKVVDKVLLYVNTTKKSDGSVTKAAPADMAKLNSGVRENVYTKNLSITAIDPGDTYTVVSEVVYTDGTTLRTENRNIRRYIVEEMPAMHTIDFENGQKPSFTTFGSYQATLNSIAIDDTVHMLKLDITDGTEWSEHKVKFLGFPKTSGGLNLLPCTKKVSFELYYEKKSGTAGTFKPYIALEPNWVKTAIDLNRISVSAIETNAAKSDDDLSKRTDYDIKTIEGKDYYWMKITIEFLTDSTYNGLAVCPTTENLKVNGTAYSGICYMDNIVFYGYPDGILDAPIDPPADVEFYTA